ncbi:ADP-dependent NAD(P)H-hydrate dehydratase [Microbacterium hydrocarbonoxydans]|uniref:ADP-dependent NAD(P)H-hydrate dehydratase n=1 Tax=Microbacterium hydrocarbonoxydans TaxID=273678 RepID=UPI0007BB4372|nr:ADP/ATP-dependent (S)-NAD(P)H-hydrate dehydratase [Microbacterium hydrocarbonoxydans]GAT72721.1 ADP-dependent (S)-NAD(P)H-hydrate dehydratase [Microbacterium sp. HM58-2]
MVDIREWSRADAARFLRVPGEADDKYSRGVVALRTGSPAYPGAAVLGVEAAWRAGAGFVRYVGEGRAADAVLARRPETVAGPDTGRSRIGAWVIGSGTDAMHRSTVEAAALREILAGTTPVVVDAGALDLAPGATAPLLLTPHAGEFARLRELLELPATGDRAADAERAAAELGATVLLKGARTLIAAPAGGVIEVAAGTGWLATAGTGDVLAGILGALVAANPDAPLAEVAASGAWLHGSAARLAAGAVDGAPGHPIVALDVAEALPHAIAELLP